MPRVQVVPLLELKAETRDLLLTAIEQQTTWPAELMPVPFNPQYAYDQVREQYHSSQLLLGLKNKCNPDGDKILAIVPFDLFIPILTFVFGEAHLNGPCAVVSIFRLRPEFYGLPPAPGLVVERLIKECIHELGHTYGLRHCRTMGCVLNASTYVEEIDLKTHEFCEDCRGVLLRNAHGIAP